MTFWDVGGWIVCICIIHVGEVIEYCTHPLNTLSANVHLAKQDVAQDPQHRQRKNHDHSGNPRRRLPIRPQKYPHQYCELGQDKQDRQCF